MRSFKRTMTIAFTITMLCFVILGGCRCSLASYPNYKFETDGTYYYHLEENGYRIAGLKDNTQEVLYIPSHFKGTPVVDIGEIYAIGLMGLGYRFSTIVNYNLKKIYYSYNIDFCDPSLSHYSSSYAIGYDSEEEPSFMRIRSFAKETFFVYTRFSKDKIKSVLEGYCFQTKDVKCEIIPATAYVTRKLFESEYDDSEYIQKVDDLRELLVAYKFEAYVQIANTAYFFNYEEAPNEGYFFINNFEYGGLIEDTPYKPIRDGYNFAGWYKEPECVNKWDFEKDKLHEEKYDEEGNFVFEELNLYAKWVKK